MGTDLRKSNFYFQKFLREFETFSDCYVNNNDFNTVFVINGVTILLNHCSREEILSSLEKSKQVIHSMIIAIKKDGDVL